MNSYYLQFFLLITASTLISAQQTDQIVINVGSEQQLLPIYMAPFSSHETHLKKEYLAELEKVLKFDLSNNGSNYLLEHTPARIEMAKQFNAQTEALKKEKIYHLLKIDIQKDLLTANLYTLKNKTVKSLENLPLNGNLADDRKQMHILADTIHKALFGTNGIASTRILFTHKYQQAGKWLSEIWEADYDGANKRKISKAEAGYCIMPLYLPAQAKSRPGAYLYVTYKGSQPKIRLANLKGTVNFPLCQLSGSQIMPAISRQRDQVAFISDVSGNPDIFLIPFSVDKGAIGKPRQIFAHYGATQGSPAFSPDGKSIAFVSNKDGSTRIYVMKIPSPDMKIKEIKPKLISRANRESSAPAWSQDGKMLAYCAHDGKARQIWIYDFAEDKEWQLTKGPENKENPSWAPNSLHLVYNTSGKSSAQLYIANIKQKVAHPLTIDLPGEKRFPSWEPIAD